MSESERRRRLPYTRVLIETERILDPQFNDMVAFLSGAQLEMLRNLTQYLHRRSTFSEDVDAVGYLTPSTEDWDSIQAIVADLEETLMGNPNTLWGYKDRWFDHETTESVGDPYTDAQTDPVPAGYVYVLEAWTVQHTHGDTRSVLLYVLGAPETLYLYNVPALPSAEYVYAPSQLTMKEGDFIRFRVYGLDTGKYARLRVWGHTMAVP